MIKYLGSKSKFIFLKNYVVYVKNFFAGNQLPWEIFAILILVRGAYVMGYIRREFLAALKYPLKDLASSQMPSLPSTATLWERSPSAIWRAHFSRSLIFRLFHRET
jgi:hypothetical protein